MDKIEIDSDNGEVSKIKSKEYGEIIEKYINLVGGSIYSAKKEEYERVRKEIEENEEVLALSKVRDSLNSIIPSSLAVITNKRILIRYFWSNPAEVKPLPPFSDIDIPLTEVDGNIIKKGFHGGIKFVFGGAKYKIANTSEIDRFGHIKRQGKLYEIFVNSMAGDASDGLFINMIHVDGIPFLGGKEVLLNLYPDKLIIIEKNDKNKKKFI